MIRRALTTLAISSLSLGSAVAQTPASTATAAACHAAVPATHRTLSAKASTPIRGTTSDALAPRRDTKGSNAPKSSTPIRAEMSLQHERPRTSGAVTPKGSTPVASAASGLIACAQ